MTRPIELFSFNECMTMIKNISPYFDQDAIESSASTSEPLLKHPGKVFYFHPVDSDRYNIFKLNGEMTIILSNSEPLQWSGLFGRTL